MPPPMIGYELTSFMAPADATEREEKCGADRIGQDCDSNIHVTPLAWALRLGDSVGHLTARTRQNSIVVVVPQRCKSFHGSFDSFKRQAQVLPDHADLLREFATAR